MDPEPARSFDAFAGDFDGVLPVGRLRGALSRGYERQRFCGLGVCDAVALRPAAGAGPAASMLSAVTQTTARSVRRDSRARVRAGEDVPQIGITSFRYDELCTARKMCAGEYYVVSLPLSRPVRTGRNG